MDFVHKNILSIYLNNLQRTILRCAEFPLQVDNVRIFSLSASLISGQSPAKMEKILPVENWSDNISPPKTPMTLFSTTLYSRIGSGFVALHAHVPHAQNFTLPLYLS